MRWLRVKRRVEEIRASRARTVAAGLQEQMEDGTYRFKMPTPEEAEADPKAAWKKLDEWGKEPEAPATPRPSQAEPLPTPKTLATGIQEQAEDGTYRFKPVTAEEAKTMTTADVTRRMDEWANAGETPNPEAKPVDLPATPKPIPPQSPVTKKGPNWKLAFILVFAGSVVGSCNGYQLHLNREADLNRERGKKEAAAQAVTEKAEEVRAADSVPPEIKQKWERYQACLAAGDTVAVHSVDSQWMRYCLN
ncbi:hypothetical protein [Synechococcus sp. Cruz CV-v-12]|nr:hypothetical protein [Synechococcus sp. Cruz CV-v-12]MCP9872567.1 hypothetical protein [Synechococcus sp. Cruz CV-v-12]